MQTIVRYTDLRAAGPDLATALEPHVRELKPAVVLAIVRGGVPAGIDVATRLALPLDVICLRAILQRRDGTLARASRVAGTLAIDDDLKTPTPGSEVEHAIREGLEALAQREAVCRGDRPPFPVEKQTVLLVDNGMRTGSSMLAAIRALHILGSGPVIAAVPVSSSAALAAVTRTADRTISLGVAEPFGNVGMFYKRLDVPTETDIGRLLHS